MYCLPCIDNPAIPVAAPIAVPIPIIKGKTGIGVVYSLRKCKMKYELSVNGG